MSWWKSAVVYQVYPRSFADSNGDGIGDLRGLLDKLDYLDALGVDVVWVSPFYRSPHRDNGYDISDHRQIDPLKGTLADVDELIAALHQRDMKLMIDVVLNHTSDEHPWFVESRSSHDNPKRDWYWWRTPRPGTTAGQRGAEPTNWLSFFSEPAWTLDDATGEYYLHLFSRHQPDLNWENPEVRRAMYDILRWWLARGVDGFRMDVVNLLSKRVPLRDGPVAPGRRHGDGTAEYSCGPRIHEFLQELHEEVLTPHPTALVTVGEMPGVTVEEALLYTDPERRELDMVFQLEHMHVDRGPGGRFDIQPLRLPELKHTLRRWQTGLATTGWNSLYLGNHDQPRIVSRFGDDEQHRVASAKALATVLLLHRGTPYIYQGEELGMTNSVFGSLDDFDDIESINYARHAAQLGMRSETILDNLRTASRDNARTPMQWDDGPNAGFSTGTPWLPVNTNHRTINTRAQLKDPDSVFHHYRQLIALRHQHQVVADGDFTMLLPDHEQIYAFTRQLIGEATEQRMLVLANLSSEPASATLDQDRRWSVNDLVLASGTARCPGPDVELALHPWEAQVYLATSSRESGTKRSSADPG